ncbi:probable ubiquitin carboxyl-terminal hydrolase MINDY-4 isoform X2 [Gigantopelta aegis]|uniref:probable ubiquitin carboxyl-terminal hydrolase MINDY-4 isoform X2 n=1 Tax=Gigantopelta aegis TaxID=1735272 RepID=UPI001B887E2A|nr:probable ubiquitin carboxyl-terminal hydrolase MINDY-4 isoform X2 [Gigantopelta aegis]
MMGSSSDIAETQKLNKLLQFLEQSSRLFADGQTKLPECKAPVATELFKKQNTILNERWTQNKNERGSASDGLLLNYQNGPTPRFRCFVGGKPITLQQAMELRKITYGSCQHSFGTEWRKSSLSFQNLDGKFPYGILGHRCGSRGLALCVQAFLLKHLIFDREYKSSLFALNALQPNSYERRRAFVSAVSEMLWQAGDRQRCSVCLMQEESCFGPDYRYRADRITEKLYIFDFSNLEDLQTFIRRNLDSETVIYRLYVDMDTRDGGSSKLLTDMDECSPELINLLLTGQAIQHLHNGDLVYDNDGNLLSKPIKGIANRSSIGYLFWDRSETEDKRTEIGSMLKTPKYPIWLIKVNNQFGLLFSNNLDLVSDWRVEHRFLLHYYTGLPSTTKPTQLTVDTRYPRSRPKTSLLHRRESDKIPPLEHCIMTKWYDATVDWNGTVPYV